MKMGANATQIKLALKPHKNPLFVFFVFQSVSLVSKREK